jgi:hypothetical protein
MPPAADSHVIIGAEELGQSRGELTVLRENGNFDASSMI